MNSFHTPDRKVSTRVPDGGADAQRHAAEVAHLCLALHAALVRGGLSGRTG